VIVLVFTFVFDDAKGEKYMTFWVAICCYLLFVLCLGCYLFCFMMEMFTLT
jgi:hypothetical protein